MVIYNLRAVVQVVVFWEINWTRSLTLFKYKKLS